MFFMQTDTKMYFLYLVMCYICTILTLKYIIICHICFHCEHFYLLSCFPFFAFLFNPSFCSFNFLFLFCLLLLFWGVPSRGCPGVWIHWTYNLMLFENCIWVNILYPYASDLRCKDNRSQFMSSLLILYRPTVVKSQQCQHRLVIITFKQTMLTPFHSVFK